MKEVRRGFNFIKQNTSDNKSSLSNLSFIGHYRHHNVSTRNG